MDHDKNRVQRCSRAGQVKWSTPLDGDLGLVRPPHLQADAARVLVRFDPDTGRKMWESACNTLEVDEWWGGAFDSIVTVREGRLTITSRCSLGTFVEVLDAQTGRRMRDPIRR